MPFRESKEKRAVKRRLEWGLLFDRFGFVANRARIRLAFVGAAICAALLQIGWLPKPIGRARLSRGFWVVTPPRLLDHFGEFKNPAFDVYELAFLN